MGFIKEFKEFAIKGNMIDMAVGIIIGGAFGTVVKSLVEDVIMPPIGAVTGDMDFSDLKLPLGEGEKAATLNWGSFLTNIISFKREEEEKPAAPPEPSEEVKLLTEIRNALQKS